MLDAETQQLARSLYKFMKKRFGFTSKPHIKFKYSEQNAANHLGMTGHYDPDSEEIVIFCANRHPKDILRSLAHELMHHVQKHEGMLSPEEAAPEGDQNYIVHDKHLEKIEADAFDRGNIAFRFWEAEQKMNGHDKSLNQEEVEENKTKTGNEKNEACMDEGADCQEKNVNENVEVNPALKDSVVYVKDDRACNDLYNNREETIFQDLLKKFGIKK